ncbi:hypothetical protein MWU59_08355 [Flavobacteriaceae bacterium F08102]|nr:hypothetical protein [Flavobacteriaceae bacterium F08102]
MSINHIVSPLDSAKLDSKDQYVFYHKMVDFALKELIVSMQQNRLCTQQELIFFKQYADLLLYSIEAMRIKYMYDPEDHMKVDLTNSGFPNYLEFRYLYNDLSLKNNYLAKLTDIDTLKAEFLDQLLVKKQTIKKDRLFQAASVIYYTSVKKEYIFNRFAQGKIIDSPANSTQYMTSWSFYDVAHNRPFICYMYFDYEGKNIQAHKQEIYAVLKQTADREMPLDTMAYTIDRRLEKVRPRHIKRIDLGPFHNIFAKDEHALTHSIIEGIVKKEIPLSSYALSLSIDEVSAGSTFEEGGFFSRKTLQHWNEVQQSRYVFAPHRIVQLLENKNKEYMNGLAKAPMLLASIP